MSKEEIRPEDDPRFDRLVDDELNEEERRELLSGLDKTPGGWRACAIAFLEAQAWKKTFGAMVPERSKAEPTTKSVSLAAPASTPAPTPRHSRPLQWTATITAVAASFLVALVLGLWLKDMWRSGDGPQPGPNMLVRDDKPSPSVAPDEPTPDAPAPDVPLPSSDMPSSPWQLVTLGSPDGTSGGSIQLPARQCDRLDSNWADSVPQAMPEEVRRALERTGHHVRQRRELVPMEMEDGRNLVVPVDQVDVHYVGNPTL